MKMFKTPYKSATMLAVIIVFLFGFLQCVGTATERRADRLERHEQSRIQSKINQIKSQIESTPTPTPQPRRVSGVVLPGQESAKIRTDGARFEFRFRGTMYVHLYLSEVIGRDPQTGKEVSVRETLTARNGSYEIRVRDSTIPEIVFISFERPAELNTPLAFIVDIYDQ